MIDCNAQGLDLEHVSEQLVLRSRGLDVIVMKVTWLSSWLSSGPVVLQVLHKQRFPVQGLDA